MGNDRGGDGWYFDENAVLPFEADHGLTLAEGGEWDVHSQKINHIRVLVQINLHELVLRNPCDMPHQTGFPDTRLTLEEDGLPELKPAD